jgi:cell wall-associated NlpC family hydrolase
VDCYGLLYLVYKEVLNIEIPPLNGKHINPTDRKAIADLVNNELDPWTEIEKGKEQSFDAILVRIGRDVMHVGMVADPGKMLHIENGSMSQIEPYRTGKLKHRVAGFYRYRGL